MAADGERFVYVLRSAGDGSRSYVGVTADVSARLSAHNAGRCAQTARNRPWQLHVVIAFADVAAAVRFERFLKSATGREFARTHFGV
jgi:predicted GIY-YIG superfamily endonuclease